MLCGGEQFVALLFKFGRGLFYNRNASGIADDLAPTARLRNTLIGKVGARALHLNDIRSVEKKEIADGREMSLNARRSCTEHRTKRPVLCRERAILCLKRSVLFSKRSVMCRERQLSVSRVLTRQLQAQITPNPKQLRKKLLYCEATWVVAKVSKHRVELPLVKENRILEPFCPKPALANGGL